MQFIHLKCTVQWSLGYSQSRAPVATIKFRTFALPRKTPAALDGHSPPLPHPTTTPHSGLGHHDLHPVSRDVLPLHIPYKRNQTKCGPL